MRESSFSTTHTNTFTKRNQLPENNEFINVMNTKPHILLIKTLYEPEISYTTIKVINYSQGGAGLLSMFAFYFVSADVLLQTAFLSAA